jgi:hypothetical protein
MEWAMPILLPLERENRTVSPSLTRITGPGAVPLNVHTSYGVSLAICWTVSTASRCTLTTCPDPAPWIR